MAENDNGRLNFGIGIDLDDLQRGADEAKGVFDGIASEAQAKGADIDRAFGTDAARGASSLSSAVRQSLSDIGRSCAEHEAAIASLEGEYSRLGREMSKAYESGRDGDLQEIQERATAVKAEISVRKDLLSQLREQADALEQEASRMEGSRAETEALGEAHSSLRQRIRELQEQMAQLREQGIDETSEAYRELTAELGRLRDIQSDIQKQGSVLANDQAQFQGIISGLQGVSGGYTAVSGAMSLFGTKNEDLNRIMAKAQSLMSITIGLQQVSQMLDKDSAFQLTTVAKVREWWNKLLDVGRGKTTANTAAVELNTAAQKGNSAALKGAGAAQQFENVAAETGTAANIGLAGAFRMVGAAIKSIPVFGWIAAAISAIVSVVSHFVSKAKEAREAEEEARKEQEEWNSSVAEMAAEPVAAVMKLQAQWNALGDDLEAKRKFIRDNAEEFRKLGLAIKDVNDAEEVFTSAETLKKYINAQLVRAQADKTFKSITNTVKDQNKAMVKLKEAQENLAKAQETPTVTQTVTTMSPTTGGMFYKDVTVANPEIEKYTDEVQKYNDEIEGYDKKIKDSLERFNELNGVADRLMEEIGAGGEKIVEGSIEALQADLKKWQDLMNRAVIGSEEYIEAQKRVNEIQAQLNAAMGKTSAADADKEAKARETALTEEGKIMESLTKSNEKARIDQMKDGHDKRMAQLDYDYEQEMAKIEGWEERLRKDNETTGVQTIEAGGGVPEWQVGLTEEQRNEIEEARKLVDEAHKRSIEDLEESEREAERKREAEQRKSLDRLLQQTATYQQASEALERRHEEDLKLLYDEEGNLREGVTQRNVDILNAQYYDDQRELWESYMDSMESLSIEALQGLVGEMQGLVEAAKSELEELEGSNEDGGNDERIAELKQRIATLTKQCTDAQERYNKKQKEGRDDNKELEDSLKELANQIGNTGDAFGDLGDAIGGSMGEALKDIGDVMNGIGSVANSIFNFVDQGIKGIEGAMDAANLAMKAAESSTAILAMMEAVMEIATVIADLFNNDDKKQEEIDELQNRIDQLQWELDNAEAARVRDATGGALSAVSEMYQQALKDAKAANKEGRSYVSLMAEWTQASKKATAADVAHEKTVEGIIRTYANLGYTVDKAIGEDKYKAAGDAVKNYAEQLALTYEQYEKEQSKKKTDTDKLKEYEQTMDELAESMVDTLNSAVEDIIGGSYEDIAKQLGDAFVEAFQAGEDAAEAWGDTVEDIVSDIVRQMLIQQWIEPKIADIFDKYMARWFNGEGEYQGNQAVIDSMDEFSEELNGAMGDFAEAWADISEAMGWLSDSTREAATQGIAAASQESIDELNGRMTAIQGHTYSINDNVAILVSTNGLILQSVLNIESNTDRLVSALEEAGDTADGILTAIDDMQLKGVRVR